MTPSRPRTPRAKSRSAARHALALFAAALYLIPLFYVVLASLTPTGESIGRVPSRLAWDNYAQALESANFLLFFGNSAIVALTSTLAQVALSCAAGYALALLPLRGRNAFMLLVIALLVVPPEVVLVPLFVGAAHFPLVGGNDLLGNGGQGLLDSLPGLMVPHLISALGIFLMRQFYATLPRELGDAARVDGASEYRIFSSIYTPLVRPAVAVVAVFAFQSAWNDFLWPLVLTRSNEMRTLQLGLTIFFQENSTQWNLLMAAVLVISIPVLLLFLYIQRFFKEGGMTGALK